MVEIINAYTSCKRGEYTKIYIAKRLFQEEKKWQLQVKGKLHFKLMFYSKVLDIMCINILQHIDY